MRGLKDYDDFHHALESGKIEKFFEGRPAELQASVNMKKQAFHNPLQVRYWSQTPYKLGPHAIKFSARPISRTTNARPEKTGPNYLREVMVKQVGREDVYFDFLVQVQTDPVKMPVEDSVVEWQESDSPFQRVALIRIPKQDISSPDNLKAAENLSFTPWHALPEHRPLGSINRARRVVYEVISEYRHRMNKVPHREPGELPKR
jgi:hypothetical protein